MPKQIISIPATYSMNVQMQTCALLCVLSSQQLRSYVNDAMAKRLTPQTEGAGNQPQNL